MDDVIADDALDPVTLAVLNGRLEQIADEMDATLFRTAFNPIIAEAHDASHGLYHPQTGATLVQGKSGLPIFVGVMAFAVKSIIDKVAVDGGLNDGDVYIFNDAYDGGTHLSDFKLVRPYFRDGELFCYLASVGHWHDVGGNVPGNYNPSAVESFQEGMLIPPIKLVDAGEINKDLITLLQANSRQPRSLYGDLNGQLSALDLGMRRLDELMDQYGLDKVQTATQELTQRAERLMRAAIDAIPDGVYEAEDFLDNDGIVDSPLRISLAIRVAGDSMTLDFTGTAPGCQGPVNISESTAIAACYVALKHVFTDVPANAGVLRPITFVIPDGCLLKAKAPKPVGGYTETILRMIDVVFSALGPVAPERVYGNAYGTINALSLSGHRQDGSRWVMFSFFGGGLGGSARTDGLSHGNAPISTATIPPLEILEAAYPVMFSKWALRPDSGGPGEHRGGLGGSYEVELLEDHADVFLFGERGRFPPRGVAGGGNSELNRFRYEASGEWCEPPLVSKLVGLRMKRGEKLRLETPGGGGFGNPANRDPEAVRRDVKLGYISADAAQGDYGLTDANESKPAGQA